MLRAIPGDPTQASYIFCRVAERLAVAHPSDPGSYVCVPTNDYEAHIFQRLAHLCISALETYESVKQHKGDNQ